MTPAIDMSDVRMAWEAKDPILVELLIALVSQQDPQPSAPVREGVMTFQRFLQETRSRRFRKKTAQEQEHYRRETWKALEAENAESPLPDRLRVHEVVLELWRENSPFARQCLLQIIAQTPLRWGPWRALKRIFKEAEEKNDTEVFGALAARFDMQFAKVQRDRETSAEIDFATYGYLCRRAWRYLRRTAQTLPACYADVAVDVLANYTDDVVWFHTWIANHIFYHQTHRYTAKRFNFDYQPPPRSLAEARAFAELWRRTPRPLFLLLERARSEHARQFAVSALQTDFRASLREIEAAWVARLVHVRSNTIDQFVVWLLNHTPRFEQAAFRELGLHEAVLRLFGSPSDDARVYAAEYARTYARDLPVAELIRLINNDHKSVRRLAADLLQALDPRNEVGLDAWGQLLEMQHGYKLASEAIAKHFGAQELTPAWFAERMLSRSRSSAQFAQRHLPNVHPYKSLGAEFFCGLVDELGAEPDDPQRDEVRGLTAQFALEVLEKEFDPNALGAEFLQRTLVCPQTSHQVCRWINEGRLDAGALPVNFFQSLAFHPQWEQDPWITELRRRERRWAKKLQFDEDLCEIVLAWLGDPRRFSAEQLGLDWLMQLVGRSEPQYHGFAKEVLIRSFRPADFAPQEALPAEAVLAGCRRLWEMATEPDTDQTPQARFALQYLRRHHPDICLTETETPLAPGAEIPADFLSFAQLKPLFFERRTPLRQFALELAKWELARWSPPIGELIQLCEAPHAEVRQLIAQALLAEDSPEHARYRLDPDVLTSDAVYSFCESVDEGTRALGMELIDRYRRLKLPEELFRLTESPDRKVRAFVIRSLWSLYRHRGVTENWRPTSTPTVSPMDQPPKKETRQKTKKGAKKEAKDWGEGAPAKPENLPAQHDSLQRFLRRMLFEIPPAKFPKASSDENETVALRLKPLPARKAKLALVEVMRDLAIEEREFAHVVAPLLTEFMESHGQSERAACLVAVTRIRHAHPSLNAPIA